MTDYFALLGEARRPWLDAQTLKQKFLMLSADAHPDRIHDATGPEKKSANDSYTQLNAAYQCLSNPRDRVRHLVELELGRKPNELDRVPSELMDSFMAIAEILRKTDKFLDEREKNIVAVVAGRTFRARATFHRRVERD